MMADTVPAQQEFVDTFCSVTEYHGVAINVKKTNVMQC